jgi:hypothetical protein
LKIQHWTSHSTLQYEHTAYRVYTNWKKWQNQWDARKIQKGHYLNMHLIYSLTPGFVSPSSMGIHSPGLSFLTIFRFRIFNFKFAFGIPKLWTWFDLMIADFLFWLFFGMQNDALELFNFSILIYSYLNEWIEMKWIEIINWLIDWNDGSIDWFKFVRLLLGC